MAQSNFKFELLVGKFQGSSMSLQVFANEQEVYNNSSPTDSKIFLDFDCSLPAQIKFVLGNKNQNDTQVNELGEVVEDKHIQVSRLIVDRMPVDQWMLESRLFQIFPENTKAAQSTNYFSYNGTAVLTIPNQDSFEFFLGLNSKG